VSDPVSDALAQLLEETSSVSGGEVADYIPELANADPDDHGIALVSVLGRTYTAGDASTPFTIQSVSKAFVYALAVDEHGLEVVAERVGFEPSGESYNAISLEEDSGRPANPLINAGAIVTSALVPGDGPAAQRAAVEAGLSAFAGRDLAVNDEVFRSEVETGDRNRALAYLTKWSGALPGEVDDAIEVYVRQCSVMVTAEDLAIMGATLANGGRNPRTGEQVVGEEAAQAALSIMATCGMYDHSGEWMVRVGLPAKSGVGGGIVAAQPAQFGIGVYSPPLDEQGNSVRGVAGLEALSREFRLHLLAHPDEPRSPVESSRSDDDGHVVALRGEIDFIAAEQVVHELETLGADGLTIRLDLSAVTRIRPAAERLLAATAEDLAGSRCTVVADDPSGVVEQRRTARGGVLPTTTGSGR
jgi:glutaminase